MTLDVELAEPILNVSFVLVLQSLSLGQNLLLDVVVCLGRQHCVNLFGYVVALLLLDQSILVPGLQQLEVPLELLSALLLLLKTLILLFELDVELLLFGQASDVKMPALALRL